jgi:hypothetical protein
LIVASQFKPAADIKQDSLRCDRANINADHMGMVLIVTLAFGLITPPHGPPC